MTVEDMTKAVRVKTMAAEDMIKAVQVKTMVKQDMSIVKQDKQMDKNQIPRLKFQIPRGLSSILGLCVASCGLRDRKDINYRAQVINPDKKRRDRLYVSRGLREPQPSIVDNQTYRQNVSPYPLAHSLTIPGV
jgi:hypothetical protein